MPGSAAAVICRGVVKSYLTGKVSTPALRGVDLEILSGELFMLVGPSGCGKTTLISVIAGILNQDEGDIRVLGTDIASIGDEARTAFRGRNIGFVFQSYNLIPTLTVQENASIPLLLGGARRDFAMERAAEVLRRVGLESKLTVFPTNLSGGQQQRVAIARALVHEPKIVVCDEPTSALDHKTGSEVMDLFKEEAERGQRTLVIVTHDARIFSYASRIGHMDDGVVTRIESPG